MVVNPPLVLYTCSLCPKKYKSNGCLVNHLRKKHPVPPSEDPVVVQEQEQPVNTPEHVMQTTEDKVETRQSYRILLRNMRHAYDRVQDELSALRSSIREMEDFVEG